MTKKIMYAGSVSVDREAMMTADTLPGEPTPDEFGDYVRSQFGGDTYQIEWLETSEGVYTFSVIADGFLDVEEVVEFLGGLDEDDAIIPLVVNS